MAEIRRATPADTEALIAMGAALHAESPRYRDMAFKPEKLRQLAERLADPAAADLSAVFVAESAGEPVGMFVAVMAERWFCDELYVTDLTVYVKPEHRGGSSFFRLVRAVEQWAAERGVTDIAVGVSTEVHAERTVRAYERLGYTLSGYTVTKALNHHGN